VFRYAQNAKKALIRVLFLIAPNEEYFSSLLFFAHEVLDHAAKHLEAKKYSSFLLIAHADARKAPRGIFVCHHERSEEKKNTVSLTAVLQRDRELREQRKVKM